MLSRLAANPGVRRLSNMPRLFNMSNMSSSADKQADQMAQQLDSIDKRLTSINNALATKLDNIATQNHKLAHTIHNIDLSLWIFASIGGACYLVSK